MEGEGEGGEGKGGGRKERIQGKLDVKGKRRGRRGKKREGKLGVGRGEEKQEPPLLIDYQPSFQVFCSASYDIPYCQASQYIPYYPESQHNSYCPVSQHVEVLTAHLVRHECGHGSANFVVVQHSVRRAQ